MTFFSIHEVTIGLSPQLPNIEEQRFLAHDEQGMVVRYLHTVLDGWGDLLTDVKVRFVTTRSMSCSCLMISILPICCSLRIHWKMRVLTLSRYAASRVGSNLSGDTAFLSLETARMCAAISAIYSINDLNAELSIVITFISSPSFLFLRQNWTIDKRGFKSSLPDI